MNPVLHSKTIINWPTLSRPTMRLIKQSVFGLSILYIGFPQTGLENLEWFFHTISRPKFQIFMMILHIWYEFQWFFKGCGNPVLSSNTQREYWSRQKLSTHWVRVTHIWVSNLTIIGSDNGLSPGQRQAIIWTNAGMLLIGPLGTNFSEILVEIHRVWLKKMPLKMSSGKWRPFCLGLNVLSCQSISLVNHLQPWAEII